MSLNCIILDDHQNIAQSLADWASLAPLVHTTSLTEHDANQSEWISQIARADILVVMGEHTALSAEMIGHLPQLKMVVTFGMQNTLIDLHACAERYIAVCGTENRAAADACRQAVEDIHGWLTGAPLRSLF